MLLVSNSLWKYKKYILTAEIQARSLFPHFIYYSFQAQNVLQMYVGQCSTSEILRVNVLQMGRILWNRQAWEGDWNLCVCCSVLYCDWLY